MPTVNCPACAAEILTYEEGTAPQTIAIIPEGEDVPGGDHVVHICPKLPPYAQAKRTSDALDWTDLQERAMVSAALPDWKLAKDDEIVCMRWYTPGAGRAKTAAGSAPLTVQVRRAGVDLKYAGPDELAEASFGAAAAIAIIDQAGIVLTEEDRAAFQSDLEAEQRAALAAEEAKVRLANSTAEAAAVWAQALTEARDEAAAALEHAKEHPDDGDLQAAASAASSTVAMVTENAERTRAEADQAAAAIQP